jgi:hypothetical protein
MGKRYLIDSNTVIDFLDGKLPGKGKELLLKINPEISVITYIEILSKKDLPVLESQRYKAFISKSLFIQTSAKKL